MTYLRICASPIDWILVSLGDTLTREDYRAIDNLSEHVRSHYSTVYITICSVLLGLCLGDVVTILRTIESHSILIWLQAMFVVFLIFNAWYAFSVHAITIQLMPTVGDSLSVFFLAAGNFAITAFIGAEQYLYWIAVSMYSLVAIPTLYMNFARASKDPNMHFEQRDIYPLTVCAFCQAVSGFILAWLTYLSIISDSLQPLLCITYFVFPVIWLYLHNKTVQEKIFKQ